MIDDVVEAVWGLIKQIVIHILFEIVLFYLGFITLKLITFWKYPPENMTDSQARTVSLVGVLVPFLIFGVFFVVNNYGPVT